MIDKDTDTIDEDISVMMVTLDVLCNIDCDTTHITKLFVHSHFNDFMHISRNPLQKMLEN